MTSEEKQNFYKNKVIAGPMVKASSLIFRLTSLDYGADLVFSPGLTDLSINQSKVKEEDGIYTLYREEGTQKKYIFKTVPEEKDKLVLQLVSVDGPNAALSAQIVDNFVSAYDINCGCPEKFACHRGGGSKITIDSMVDIIKTLNNTTSHPISVKIRIRDTLEETLQFAHAAEQSGVSAITIHGRLVENKRSGDVDFDHMKQAFDDIKVAKIGNGGITSLAEGADMKLKTGCDSIMICSSAMKNPSIFSGTLEKVPDVLNKMIDFAEKYKENYEDAVYSLREVCTSNKSFNRRIDPILHGVNTLAGFRESIIKAQET